MEHVLVHLGYSSENVQHIYHNWINCNPIALCKNLFLKILIIDDKEIHDEKFWISLFSS